MTTCSSRSEEALGPLPSPVRRHLRVRTITSARTQDGHLAWPGPSSEAALSSMYTAEDRQGCLRGWGHGAPSLPSSPGLLHCGPHRRVCMRALPRLPLTSVSASPQHTGISAFKLALLPSSHPLPGLCSGWAFGIQGSGVLQQSWGEKGKTAPKMADMATHLCLSLTNEFSLRMWHSEGIPTSPATALGPRPQCQPPLPLGPPHSWCLLQLRVPYLTTPSFPVPTKEAASYIHINFVTFFGEKHTHTQNDD